MSQLHVAKTNAVRLLEKLKLPYKLFPFEIGDEHLSADEVAQKVGWEPERVFKTLLTWDGEAYFVFCVPGNFELDLKKAAKAAESKKIEMVKPSLLFDLTGYVKGGCSPIGMKKALPTFVDETAQLHEKILVSAGIRGLQMELSPQALIQAAAATFADLI